MYYLLRFGKIILRMSVTHGVANIVANIVKSTTPHTENTLNRMTTNIAALAVGTVLSDMTSSYLEGQIDELVGGKENKKESNPMTVEDWRNGGALTSQ